MAATLVQTLTGMGVFTSTNSFTISIPTTIAAGSTCILATYRGAPSGTNGVASIGGDGASNNFVLNAAHSCRGGNHDVNLHVLDVVAAINSGSTLTITNTSVSTRKMGILAVYTGLEGAFDATSGGTPGDSATNVGFNGSSSSPSATTGSVSETSFLSFACNSINSAVSSSTSFTEIGEINSTAGAGERGLMLQTRTRTGVSGAQTMAATLGSSQVWAAAALTIPITPDVSSLGSVIVSGSKKSVASMDVIVSGAKKSVSEVSVIVGGVKKPLA